MLSLSEAEEAYYELSLKRFPLFSLSPGSDTTPFSQVSLTSSELIQQCLISQQNGERYIPQTKLIPSGFLLISTPEQKDLTERNLYLNNVTYNGRQMTLVKFSSVTSYDQEANPC